MSNTGMQCWTSQGMEMIIAKVIGQEKKETKLSGKSSKPLPVPLHHEGIQIVTIFYYVIPYFQWQT